MPRWEAEDYDAHVVGWERNGNYRTVYDDDGDKVGRNPTDSQLEGADRIVIDWDGEYFTTGPLTDDYTLDDAIEELEDLYGN